MPTRLPGASRLWRIVVNDRDGAARQAIGVLGQAAWGPSMDSVRHTIQVQIGAPMKLATRLPGERSLKQEDADRIAAIRGRLIEVGDRWRAAHPVLARNQNTIGLAFFLVAILGVVGDAALSIGGVIPWWLCIPMTAFWLSILHEVEHDLIHSMNFRTNKVVHNAMMFGVWFFRPSTINPWVRRRLHLHHHRVSGTESDLEERSISNGERWDGRRVIKLLDLFLGMYVRPWTTYRTATTFIEEAARTPEDERKIAWELRGSYFPLGLVHYGLWHLFIGLHIANLFGAHIAGPAFDALNVTAVVLLAPNAFRSFCLHFVSSNMHYFGDVEAHNVLQQTQVWTSKWLWPVHAFCFNFGGTHAIHHFLVRDPFYLREAIGHECREILRAGGVRFDDYGTFKRANRFAILTPGHAEI
jgi:fatty acid desaturase